VQLEEAQRLAKSIVSVEVEVMNDAGDVHYAFGTAPSVDQAVRDAVQEVIDLTGDDSYVMNEWWGLI
jgi:division protein CdvB (Snf7/Vps24/ESCRT-III family)